MEHIAELSEADFGCLARALRPGHTLVRPSSDRRAMSADMSVVLDLSLPSTMELLERLHSSARVVLLVELTSVHRLKSPGWVRLEGGRSVQYVWRDSTMRWIERVDARLSLSGTTLAIVQSRVVAHLGRLSASSVALLVRALGMPDEPLPVIRSQRARCDRELRNVGLSSLARIHGVARFASAMDRILAGHGPLVRVALDVGLSSARSLEYQSRRLLGHTLGDVRCRAVGDPASIGERISPFLYHRRLAE